MNLQHYILTFEHFYPNHRRNYCKYAFFLITFYVFADARNTSQR